VNGTVPPALTSGRVLVSALAATGPLTVVNLIASPAYPGGLILMLVGFFVVGLVLLAFAAGYGAVSRRAPSPGPLYAAVTHGLGRPPGLGAALIALLSYGALQLSLYAAAATTLRLAVPWWQVALVCWLVVGLLGTVGPRLLGVLLGVVVAAEVVVIAAVSAVASRPALTLPAHLDRPALGLLLAGVALTFAGFETAAGFAEGPGRPSITRTTGVAVLLLSVLYAGAAGTPGPFLATATTPIAPWAEPAARVVLLTGLLAGMVALHHTSTRYFVALARDRRPVDSARGAGTASLVQTVIMGLVLCALVAFGPLAGVPRWVGIGGAIGILVLLTAASLAALIFLNRTPGGENAGQRLLAPIVATVGLGALSYLAFANLGALLGTGPQTRIVPIALGVAALAGVGYGLVLRVADPVTYARIGLSGMAIMTSPVSTRIPKSREPGAHRPERIKSEPIS
jgi:amino acid transporter